MNEHAGVHRMIGNGRFYASMDLATPVQVQLPVQFPSRIKRLVHIEQDLYVLCDNGTLWRMVKNKRGFHRKRQTWDRNVDCAFHPDRYWRIRYKDLPTAVG